MCIRDRGNITHLESGTVYPFESFMGLMRIFDRVLGQPTGAPDPLGKKMCEVAVCNYQDSTFAGEVSHPAVKDRFFFENEFQLLDHLELMLGERPADVQDDPVITPRQGSVCRGSIGPMTFLVRVLFRRNDTWPVSYTHLDVYKRQEQAGGQKPGDQLPPPKPGPV